MGCRGRRVRRPAGDTGAASVSRTGLALSRRLVPRNHRGGAQVTATAERIARRRRPPMATTRFDTIAKLLARRKAAAGRDMSQEATPTAWTGEKVPYLFVQSFEGGTIAPTAGEDGTYTLTLDHGLGETLYFTVRAAAG